MSRRLVRALFTTAIVVPAAAGAQTLAAPVIPSTPAGNVLRAWLDAFNSADTARMNAYYRRYQPNMSADREMAFRNQTGGFELVSIERSEPRHVEFLVKERNSPMVGFGLLTVGDSEPSPVRSFELRAIGRNATAKDLHIDAAERARVVAGAVAALDSFYVFPEGARRMGDSLQARLARGAYDAYDNGMTFAMRLNDDLRDVGHDKHLGMNFSGRPLPPQPAARPEPTPDQVAGERAEMDRMNCGFDKAEVLPGNIGYLKFDFFADTSLCAPTATAAMNFLAATRVLIIDLRENGGGSPAMVSYVASYLFSKRTHLNDLWTRRTDKTEEFWTDSVPGRRFGGEKPVYVLTSSHTFSGGEEFTYDLKTQERATIVGETTGGGAHPVNGHRVDEHFMIGVPFARAINPITHTNWEGTGVEPDVKVPASQALDRALALIRDRHPEQARP